MNEAHVEIQDINPRPLTPNKLTTENFQTTVLNFRDRQAGVSIVFDGELERFFYNAYCIETKLLKELYSCEFDFLEDALDLINAEFGTWQKQELEDPKGCGSCIAK